MEPILRSCFYSKMTESFKCHKMPEALVPWMFCLILGPQIKLSIYQFKFYRENETKIRFRY